MTLPQICDIIMVSRYIKHIFKGGFCVSLQEYNIENSVCQSVFSNNIDDNTLLSQIEEIAKQETFDEFLRHMDYKNKYQNKVLPSLSGIQRVLWDECSDLIWVKADGSVSGLNSCRNRLCAVCNWRSARKRYAITRQIMERIENELNLNYLLFTVTVSNPTGENLHETISDMMEAVNRMQSCKSWRKRVMGAIRSLEVTYNANKDTYHPHIHYILAVGTDYYTNAELYMETWQWREMWERSMRLDYEAQINLKPIKKWDNKLISGAVAEVSKYAVKLSSIVECGNAEAVKTMMSAIRNRRLIAYTGIYKQIAAEIKNERNTIPDEYAITGTPYTLVNGKYVISDTHMSLKKTIMHKLLENGGDIDTRYSSEVETRKQFKPPKPQYIGESEKKKIMAKVAKQENVKLRLWQEVAVNEAKRAKRKRQEQEERKARLAKIKAEKTAIRNEAKGG